MTSHICLLFINCPGSSRLLLYYLLSRCVRTAYFAFKINIYDEMIINQKYYKPYESVGSVKKCNTLARNIISDQNMLTRFSTEKTCQQSCFYKKERESDCKRK